jgi:hypothetical protein
MSDNWRPWMGGSLWLIAYGIIAFNYPWLIAALMLGLAGWEIMHPKPAPASPADPQAQRTDRA